MNKFRGELRRFFGNKWVKFSLATVIYILWFVVWSRNLWMLFGIPVIYDIYVSKHLYRLLWKKHAEHKKRSKLYKETASWIEAILFAVVAASLLHIYFFQMYQIPTPSMEKTLLVGDRLCVSKVAYGPRMPNTPLSFPLVHHTMPFSQTRKSYSEAIRRPYKRLAGFGRVKRDDIVVFNFPAGDTVLLEMQNVTYYDVLRSYQRNYGPQRGRELLNRQYTVASRPADKREHYVKRCVGLPGDTIHIKAGQLYIDGKAQENHPGRQFSYTVTTRMNPHTMNREGVSYDDMGIDRNDPSSGAVIYDKTTGVYTYYHLPLTDESAARFEKMKNVVSVERNMFNEPFSDIFPNDPAYEWSIDDFGPLWIPARGATVVLTTATLPLYARIIKNYEGHELDVADGVIYIDGAPADSYTFGMDYYFMMGDNRHSSADSRFWGFVPEDHIVGKPAFIFWSTDKDRSFPKNIRWSRIFSNPR